MTGSPGGDVGVAVVSGAWGTAADEAAFAMRVLAGAASRLGPVDVFVPGPRQRRADGAFDPQGIGVPEPGRPWPSGAAVGTVATAATYRAVLVDGDDHGALALVAPLFPGVPSFTVGGAVMEGAAARLELGPGSATAQAVPIGLHVPVHALAAERPHLELGPATDYVLVLSGRSPEGSDPDVPPDDAAWLAARFPRRFIVLVDNAVASVWRSRSCVHRFRVHTRMDLWRLMAHARATVDLRPGALFGRECVESARYGVPVVVPAGSAADALTVAGAGLRFTGISGLLDAVEALDDHDARARMQDADAELDPWFGDPQGLVRRLAAALDRGAGSGPGDERSR